ncbi:MAG: ssDNA endodeoxyribonuclease [Chrysothrix sp. TS-e1954]|nr:MAG: ssDNA endodeoxyribonuclease [Chrysothrix sp. TS-e1954]
MPVLSAISSSARQLFILLRCISFSTHSHVHISPEGIRFSVEDSNAMQGLAFLDKSLFTTYRFDTSSLPQDNDTDTDTDSSAPPFQISLTALLETLQILISTDPARSSSRNDSAFPDHPLPQHTTSAFDNRVLGLTSTCRFHYEGPGSPLAVTLEEANVTTTCNLVTYEPTTSLSDIPFDRTRLSLKIVLPGASLADAIAELAPLSPAHLLISAAPTFPHLRLSATGSLGSCAVDFSKDAKLLETFQVPRPVVNTYKFAHVRAALRAMQAAAKVSVRGDVQGVLSLQFMIEMEGGGVCFVDFRFVPLLEEGEEEEAAAGEEGEEGGGR